MNSVTALNTDEMRDLYRELILDHARNPRHFGRLQSPTHQASGINPLCGDKLHLTLLLDANGALRDAAFEGSGCAISMASASLLTDTVIGLSCDAALEWQTALSRALRGERAGRDLEKLNALLGVREFPSRVKCATLAWHALSAALGRNAVPVSTEN